MMDDCTYVNTHACTGSEYYFFTWTGWTNFIAVVAGAGAVAVAVEEPWRLPAPPLTSFEKKSYHDKMVWSDVVCYNTPHASAQNNAMSNI